MNTLYFFAEAFLDKFCVLGNLRDVEQAVRLSGLQFTNDSGEAFLHRKGKQDQLEHRQHLEPACLTELE